MSSFGILGGDNSSISEMCFNYIREILPEGKTILELGSGWGTSQLSKYYKMHSIEHDGRYVCKHDSDYIYAPIHAYDDQWTAPDIPDNDGWYNVSALQLELPDIEYDLILVDGPPGYPNSMGQGKVIGRAGFYKHLDLFKTDIPLIIDDVSREAEMTLLKLVSEKLKRPYKVLDDKNTGVIL